MNEANLVMLSREREGGNNGLYVDIPISVCMIIEISATARARNIKIGDNVFYY